MTHIWIFWSSKPLSALRFILFPHISSNLWIKCCFIPLWWASGHCHPWFSSRPAPKSVLHQPPSSSPASRGFVATWLWRPLHSSPTLEDLYVVEVPFHGNRDSVWFPRERNLKKKKKRGWADAFCFLSDLIPSDTRSKFLVTSHCCFHWKTWKAPVCFSARGLIF